MNSLMQSGAALLQELSPLIENGQYLEALEALRLRLSEWRAAASPGEWRTFCGETFATNEFSRHPLSRLLRAGPLGSIGAETAQALHHPRALDVINGFAGTPDGPTPVASQLRSWELGLGFCVNLRARRLLFARELQELGDVVRYPRVLAVGCGNLREAAGAFPLESMRGGEFVAFDRERSTLNFIEKEYDYPGLRTLGGSLRDLTSAHPKLGKFDLIYLPALLDALEDFRVQALLTSLVALLEPGGRLLAANFSPGQKDAAYMEACLDWWPCYRGEEQLAGLTESLARDLRGQAIFQEEAGGSIFLDLQAL